MREPLQSEQLAERVAAVEQFARSRRIALERDRVREILWELSLPVACLDEVMEQLHHRRKRAIQRRQRWVLAIAAAIALAGAIATTTRLYQNQRPNLDKISASQSRLTLAQDKGEHRTTFERQTSPEIYYRVTLQPAPLGKKLSLGCDWRNPHGQVVHQNRYQTRRINKEVWNTRCRHQFGPASVPGTWTVQMFLGNRSLSNTAFSVQ